MAITPEVRRIHKGFVRNPLSAAQVESYDPGYLVTLGGQIESLSGVHPGTHFPDAIFIDHGNKFIYPGFIDSHVHLPQFAIMGVGQGDLLAWLRDYTYPEEARFANLEYAEKISRLFFDALLTNGTTTACIYGSVHEDATDIAFTIARECGLRAFMGKVMMDRNVPANLLEDTEESVSSSVRLFEKWNGADGGRLQYVFTPRFAGSCSMELMREVGRIAQNHDARVQTHLSENRDEIALVRSLFPSHASYTDVYASAGLLSERSIMGHCIHLSDDEIGLLTSAQTSIAFCPYSNKTLGSGVMPYARFRQAGLRIGLGTDVAGGPSLSMLRQMEVAQEAVGISAAVSLYLATLGSAEALGISDSVGNFAPGKDADFVVVDGRHVDEVWICGTRK